MVGNPPFVGGQKITGTAGTDYRNHLIAWTAGGAKGSADLVAYFFLNATKIARSLGYLATNTIAQGDTSEVGLTQIIDTGWNIHRAISSTTWPGQATLEIAKVWATAHPWSGQHVLDGRPVAGIDEMLYPLSRSGWRKQRLAKNADRSFIGSYVLGTEGFTMSPEEAQALINKHPRNADVLFPYLGGEDLNQSPTQTAPRWVINFFDWPEEKARRYPDCFSIVEQKVKPERQSSRNGEFKPKPLGSSTGGSTVQAAKKLYRTIEPLDRVLAISRVSKTIQPVFVPTGQVLSDATVVFAYDDYFSFRCASPVGSTTAGRLRHASSMRTDTRYTPSDVFETFPQPPYSTAVASAGKALNDCRSKLMVERGLGLTDVYNLVHRPSARSDDEEVKELRNLHIKLDLAVRDAYGWSDLGLGHGFHDCARPGRPVHLVARGSR